MTGHEFTDTELVQEMVAAGRAASQQLGAHGFRLNISHSDSAAVKCKSVNCLDLRSHIGDAARPDDHGLEIRKRGTFIYGLGIDLHMPGKECCATKLASIALRTDVLNPVDRDRDRGAYYRTVGTMLSLLHDSTTRGLSLVETVVESERVYTSLALGIYDDITKDIEGLEIGIKPVAQPGEFSQLVTNVFVSCLDDVAPDVYTAPEFRLDG